MNFISATNPHPKTLLAISPNPRNFFRLSPLTLIAEKKSPPRTLPTQNSAANIPVKNPRRNSPEKGGFCRVPLLILIESQKIAANRFQFRREEMRISPSKKQTARILSTENAGLLSSVVNGFAKTLLAGGGRGRWCSRRFHSRFNFLRRLLRRLLGRGRGRRRSGVLSLRSSRSRQHRNRGQHRNRNQFFHLIFSSLWRLLFFSPPTSLLCPESRSRAIASIGDSRLTILMKESS